MKRCVLVFLVAVPLQAQVPFERVMQLARMKRNVVELLSTMPSYTCAVTLQRVQRAPGATEYIALDQMRYEIANTGGRELISREGRSFEPAIEARPRSGVVSSGEYALHAKSVFGGGYAVIRFANEEILNRRPVLRWDFEIPEFGSGWTIRHSSESRIVGAQGSFWGDPEQLTLLRLHLDAVNPPVVYSGASTTVDYSLVTIGSRTVPLPQTATVVLSEVTGKSSLNIIEFSHCRQFIAESTLTFESEPDTKKPSSSQPLQVPPGLPLQLALDRAINFTRASVGDPVQATLATDAAIKAKVLVKKGAKVRGRIRRLEEVDAAPFRYGISIELTEIESEGRRTTFDATLRRIDTAIPHSIARTAWTAGDPLLRKREPHLYFVPAFPGVATILVPAPGVLPEGFEMSWM